MRSINFFSVLLIISAIVFLPAKLSSQVSIGSTDTPQGFSVLELFSNNERGLRLPQLTERQRDAMQATPEFQAAREGLAMGLQIFNTCTRCVDTWNGRQWVSLCDGETPPIIITCPGDRRMVVPQFAHFNLGGREFETARAQMRYAASLTGTSGHGTGRYHHGSLFGGRFQWGRADWAHAIGEDYQLWHGLGPANNATLTDFYVLPANRADAAGQPLSDDDTAGRFIAASTGSWLAADHSAINHLWGNGVPINTRTDNIEGLADPGVPGMPSTAGEGQYFQSTSWVIRDNDPCLALGSGWRLPTQEEWELITPVYNCDPALGITAIPVPANGVLESNENSLFTWVRVSCNEGRCWPTDDWGTLDVARETRNGFVVYRNDELGSFEFTAGVNLLGANAPEPFLFLPATGWRSATSIVTSVGASALYWTSNVGNIHNATHFTISSNAITPGDTTHGRANGAAVRCVRD